jgi:hypothetical protein
MAVIFMAGLKIKNPQFAIINSTPLSRRGISQSIAVESGSFVRYQNPPKFPGDKEKRNDTSSAGCDPPANRLSGRIELH